MKQYFLFNTLCLLLFSLPALAAEDVQKDAQKEEAPAKESAKPNRTEVLGQPSSITAGQMTVQAEQEARARMEAQAKLEAQAKQDSAQALFEESLRQMMPLDENQIQQYREWSDQRDRALLPVSPVLSSRTVRVTLEPGQKPVAVTTTANIATSLVFHDSTGQPWPITSVTNGGPSFFQILRPELPDGNLLNVMPMQAYGNSTIVVTLENRDVPLVIRLEADSVRSPERKADALVLFQLAHQGPKAVVPITQEIKNTVSSEMLAFLDHVPPKEAVKLRIRNQPSAAGKVDIWKLGDLHYIRTTETLMWPAWTAVVNGAGDVKCYEAPVTSRIMVSDQGQIHTLVLKEGGL